MPLQDVLQILSTATVTQGLKPDELSVLLGYAVVEAVPPGGRVLAEGQHSEALYIVLSGQLKVMLLALDRKDHPNRVQDIHLNTLNAGDCFGEYCLIDSELASASVVATEPTELLKILRADFQTVAAQNDRLTKMIYSNLLHILVRRLRKKDRELDLNLDGLEERLAAIRRGSVKSLPPQPAQPGASAVVRPPSGQGADPLPGRGP